MSLRPFGDRPAPPLVDRLGEEEIPTVEILLPEALDPVHLLVAGEELPLVSGLAEEDSTPVVDELGDVDGPVDLSDLGEHWSEQIVEDDLTVEPEDQVVERRARVETDLPATSPAA